MRDDESASEIERLVTMVGRLTASLESERLSWRRERHDLADQWNAKLINAHVKAAEASLEAEKLRREVERLVGELARLRGQLAIQNLGAPVDIRK